MQTHAPSPSGLLGSLRGFADGLLGSVHDRVELLATELHEEKHRLVQILLWIGAVLMVGFLAIVFASLMLVFWFWDTARVAVVTGLTGAYAVTFVVLVISLRRFLARQPRPFAATLSELESDRTCIRAEN